MSYRITTSSYFDVAAKKLAKKYPSFKQDLQTFRDELLKEDASSVKVNVLKQIIKEEGFSLE